MILSTKFLGGSICRNEWVSFTGICSIEENTQIKNGDIRSTWSESIKCQKDVEAILAMKNNKCSYGNKNRIKIDKKSKLFTIFENTSANVHDSEVMLELLDSLDAHHDLYDDSAYGKKKDEQELT